MNFKEALIAHLQGEKVEVKGESGWEPFPGEYGGSLLCAVLEGLYENYELRLAPRTITVNGVEVPAPESVALDDGVEFFVPDVYTAKLTYPYTWRKGAELYDRYLERGLVYLNKEDAIARAKAMLLHK